MLKPVAIRRPAPHNESRNIDLNQSESELLFVCVSREVVDPDLLRPGRSPGPNRVERDLRARQIERVPRHAGYREQPKKAALVFRAVRLTMGEAQVGQVGSGESAAAPEFA